MEEIPENKFSHVVNEKSENAALVFTVHSL